MTKLSTALCLAGFGLLACDSKSSTYRITSHVPSDPDGFSNALYQATATHLDVGHRVELVNNGAVFDRLAEELAKAQTSINVVLFIWRPGEPSNRIVSVITQRAKAGVACRIVVDAIGSSAFEDEVRPTLVAAGCDVRTFRPVKKGGATEDRNHRKIVVIDGKLAFTGGFGLEKPWLGNGRKPDEWRDSNAIVTGPAVSQLQQAFADNWQEVDGALLPASDFPQPDPGGPIRAAYISSTQSAHLTRAERLTQLVIAAATKRLWIANAYFVPSAGLIELLIQKRQQGVDVQIMAPSDNTDHKQVLREQRATYPDLLKAGIRIWEYQPALIHSKTMLVDDHLCVVGSINLDRLSLSAMEEGALVLSDSQTAAELARTWEDDLTQCLEIHR